MARKVLEYCTKLGWQEPEYLAKGLSEADIDTKTKQSNNVIILRDGIFDVHVKATKKYTKNMEEMDSY
jgi:hypothetical protein